MSKIGIYSGTFDPIHDGHVAFVEATAKELNLVTVYVLPEPKPRRKTNVTNLDHRKKMVELAFKDNPKIKTHLADFDDHDVESGLKTFAKHHPNDEIVLLMGADVFLNIDKWPGYKNLFERVSFAVALRTEDDGEELVFKLIDLPQAKVAKIVTGQATATSSGIRESVRSGQTPKGLSAVIQDFISENNLYKS